MSMLKQPVPLAEGFETTLKAAREGNQAELGVLLDIYRGYLVSVAKKSISQEIKVKAAPSDLVQETLLKAYLSFREFRGSTEFELRAWLGQILSRKVIDFHRHYRAYAKRNVFREVLLTDIAEDEKGLSGEVVNSQSSTETVDQAEDASSFEKALQTLSHEQRQAIQLRSIDQLSFEKIGLLLGRSADAAQKLWARAVTNLSRALEHHK